MKSRKTGLEDQSVYHEPIRTEKVGKRWIAFTRYWKGEHATGREEAQASGSTEVDAKNNLNQFLRLK